MQEKNFFFALRLLLSGAAVLCFCWPTRSMAEQKEENNLPIQF